MILTALLEDEELEPVAAAGDSQRSQAGGARSGERPANG